jgi:hypothetical protein
VEGQRHLEAYTRQLEQFLPEVASKRGVAVADNGARDAVEPNDLGEEGTSHCCHRVGVAEGYEVCSFGKVVHHGENDRLVIDLGEALDEVQGYVGPDCRQNVEGLQQTGGVEMFSLVLLACGAATHKVPDDGSGARNKEVCAEPVERLLDALVSSTVCNA